MVALRSLKTSGAMNLLTQCSLKQRREKLRLRDATCLLMDKDLTLRTLIFLADALRASEAWHGNVRSRKVTFPVWVSGEKNCAFCMLNVHPVFILLHVIIEGLFNDAPVYNLGDRWVNYFGTLVEWRWRGEHRSTWGKNASQCDFVHHKSHMDWQVLLGLSLGVMVLTSSVYYVIPLSVSVRQYHYQARVYSLLTALLLHAGVTKIHWLNLWLIQIK